MVLVSDFLYRYSDKSRLISRDASYIITACNLLANINGFNSTPVSRDNVPLFYSQTGGQVVLIVSHTKWS